MKIKIIDKLKNHSGLAVIPVFEDEVKKLPEIYSKPLQEFIKQRVKNEDFLGKKGEVVQSFVEIKDCPGRIILVGCGKTSEYKGKFARELGAKIAKQIKSLKPEEVSMLIVEAMVPFPQELVEGFLLMQYEFQTFKNLPEKPKKEIQKLNLVMDYADKSAHLSVERAEIIASAVDYVKDLVNSPSNAIDAEYMENEALDLAKEYGYKIAVINKKDLVKMKWGGILAVNQGSLKDPKCLVLEYRGGDKKEKPIVVVGKGIMFDTGGYNLKMTGFIETMHQDMAGAATVLGLFAVLKELGIKKNVVGVMPIAENLISDRSYRPADIITMFSGTTVEITNTDAEGRLILADAVHYATKFDPEMIMTVATLTGAVSVAVGNRYAGLLSNDEGLSNNLIQAGKEVDELAWPLPLHEDYSKKMESTVADLRNSDLGSNKYAGSSKGAAFIEKFVGGNKWCHLDIGGTAFTEDPLEYQQKGATAHGLRLLIKFLEQ